MERLTRAARWIPIGVTVVERPTIDSRAIGQHLALCRYTWLSDEVSDTCCRNLSVHLPLILTDQEGREWTYQGRHSEPTMGAESARNDTGKREQGDDHT